ncbi:hypothetical protein THIOKS11570026 [Thiocapsa sp. KS1]|nr:hypothetical protein THIOKS11570026 [Thiocapsa sp. KS1]
MSREIDVLARGSSGLGSVISEPLEGTRRPVMQMERTSPLPGEKGLNFFTARRSFTSRSALDCARE